MVQIIWTESASNDLIAIKEFISKESAFQAGLFLDALYTKAQVLIQFPEIGKPVPEFQDKKYRELLFKRYRIIYRFAGEYVYVISVHHSARLLINNPHFKDIFG
ncbi:MAG: type II toxin-antitoxin system RelE/ParE family toxin [Chitinophagaceae bacterium]|nr:type II toxin-antitoxin system RelE/ParE family toxin [Chitinophagaceae bacterium]